MEADIAKLLRGVETMSVKDDRRIAREMAASVIRHRLADLRAGGQGIDRRDWIDIDIKKLELKYRDDD